MFSVKQLNIGRYLVFIIPTKIGKKALQIVFPILNLITVRSKIAN